MQQSDISGAIRSLANTSIIRSLQLQSLNPERASERARNSSNKS